MCLPEETECRTHERRGPHVYEDAMYDGLPIKTCVFCGRRQDGIPWWPFNYPQNLRGKNLPSGYKVCPYILRRGPNSIGFIGCDGIGVVSQSHRARTRKYGSTKLFEEYALTEDPDDGYICQNCRGCGMVKA